MFGVEAEPGLGRQVGAILWQSAGDSLRGVVVPKPILVAVGVSGRSLPDETRSRRTSHELVLAEHGKGWEKRLYVR